MTATFYGKDNNSRGNDHMTFLKFYECGICGHAHPWDWNGDCREDANRFTTEELDQKYRPGGYELADWDERLAADKGD